MVTMRRGTVRLIKPAVWAYTQGAAYASGEERVKGAVVRLEAIICLLVPVLGRESPVVVAAKRPRSRLPVLLSDRRCCLSWPGKRGIAQRMESKAAEV